LSDSIGLPGQGIRQHGPDWVVNIFSQIGQSEDDPNYLKPGNDDVWKFLDEIADWVDNSKRLGTD